MAASVKVRSPFMRRIRVTLRVALGLFILMNMVFAFHAYQFTHFQDASVGVMPKPENMSTWSKVKGILFGFDFPKSVNKEQPSLPFDTVSLTTEDNMHLSGWFIPHDTAKGTVILFHGHGSSKSAILPEASYFHSLGYHIFLIDFRAHGDSEGNTSTIGYREARDVKAAFDYIQSRGEQHIILWGVSLGAATIAHAIAQYDIKPGKVIMELSFGSAHDAVKARVRIMHVPEEPVAGLLTFWGSVVRGFWVFGHSPETYAKKITCPVLIQHAAKDARVTRSESEAIFHNIPNQHKKLVVYENAAHESLCNREPEKWKQEIKTFLQGE